ncbi:PREDICTED: MAM and LDL-receptor class A domain-containing protein 2-like isoform X3 [Acropora digitifera]|uniref:MAM and LDL-receptor class A domain-containing protein 2-like isoform X3 n=1 Tax=Acropora digitifera TaxID=70779 RepID=UPI00077B0C9D|nr:PREDICTED: MAM and LDL-receptor class A domain-containing protein 2-like isoform X3 [Acropora digitifera]
MMKLGLIACVIVYTQLIDAYEYNCSYIKNNTLRSPRYPNNYPNNLHCLYRVSIPSDKNLVIYFNYFSLEDHPDCKWDYLKISDGRNQTNGRYCGYQTGKRVRVDGSVAVLTFHTDGSVQHGGFYLSFSFSRQPLVCGFENGLCRDWYQSHTDDFDWTRRSGSTRPNNTGPSSGYGGYGFYMSIQTSSPRSHGDKAKLLFSPQRSEVGKLSCLKFYYHMYGAAINRLNVYNGNRMVFTKYQQHGDRWLYAEMTIFVQNTVAFEGITGASYTGDIAIDDVSLMDGFCTACKHFLDDSFGHLNITYNERFSPDCVWTLGNSGISDPVAIVSIEELHLGYCSGFIKVLDGNGTEVFIREGCQANHTSHMSHQIAFEESQNITIQVALKNFQSYVRVSYCVLKNGLDEASTLDGWNFTLQNETSDSLNLQWMDINHRLNGGARLFVVIAKSSYSSVPIRKLFSPNITSAEITGLDPYTVYNVSVVVIDGNGSAFKSTVLQARTDKEDCGYVQSNTLRSPGYPSHYPNNMDCVYRVPIPIDKDLWIFFSYFSLEDNKNCTRDYLKISDGSNRRIGTYCGHQTGRSVGVVGRTAVLKFVSNRIVRYQGFTLSLMFTLKVCGFEDGLCRGWHQSYADDFDWRRHSGATWTYSTGPSSGHGGYGFYMCMDASFGGYGDKAKLLFSPPSSFIGRISCLKFYYHMYGATINRLSVFHGNSVVFTKSGQQGYRWLSVEVTLFVQNTITFEGIVGSSNTGDIAIDDVSLMDGACAVCGSVQSNNTLRSPGYPGLYSSDLFCVYRVNIPRGKDLKIHFNYFNLEHHSNCTYHDYLRIASNLYNVIGTFCGQQTGTSVRVTGNYALLTFYTDSSVQKTGFELLFSYRVFPVSCNFDYGLCSRWSQSNEDVFNWTRGTGNTPSTDTGPSSEQSSELGYYMYIEASSPRREGDNAKLVLSLPGNGKLGCLSFYYHMYGENMGTLNVFIGNMKVFTESGDHGNTWIKADRTIVLGNNVTFEGIRGSGFQGDLAIDDVLVTKGSCVSSAPTTFPPPLRPATRAGCSDKLDPSFCSVFSTSGSCVSMYNYTSVHCAKTCSFCGDKNIIESEVSLGTVVSKGMPTTLVESNMKSTGRSMESSFEPSSSPSKNEFRTNKSEGNHMKAIACGVVGGYLSLVVIVALLVVY